MAQREGEGQEAPFARRYTGFGAKSEGSSGQHNGSLWDKAAAGARRGAFWAALLPLARCSGYNGKGKGKDWAEKELGLTVLVVQRLRRPR